MQEEIEKMQALVELQNDHMIVMSNDSELYFNIGSTYYDRFGKKITEDNITSKEKDLKYVGRNIKTFNWEGMENSDLYKYCHNKIKL